MKDENKKPLKEEFSIPEEVPACKESDINKRKRKGGAGGNSETKRW